MVTFYTFGIDIALIFSIASSVKTLGPLLKFNSFGVIQAIYD
jgi:hypothetical protein